jgi:hypothetical protein
MQGGPDVMRQMEVASACVQEGYSEHLGGRSGRARRYEEDVPTERRGFWKCVCVALMFAADRLDDNMVGVNARARTNQAYFGGTGAFGIQSCRRRCVARCGG